MVYKCKYRGTDEREVTYYCSAFGRWSYTLLFPVVSSSAGSTKTQLGKKRGVPLSLKNLHELYGSTDTSPGKMVKPYKMIKKQIGVTYNIGGL